LRQGRGAGTIVKVPEEPVICREEVLTIMMLLGDQRAELERSGGYSEATMRKKRRKRTPEERAEFAAWERWSKANLERLYELVDRGWDELERKGIAKRPA